MMNLQEIPEGCARAEKIWRRNYNGVDGRAPTTYKYSDDAEQAKKWKDDPYTSSVSRCYRFTFPNGDVYYSRTVEPVENVHKQQLREQALAKLTEEEREALDLD